jgi:glycosyltransferase involved in cell wall biosynthesis
MIATIARVIRGEGARSAVRRARERIEEAARDAALHVRGAFARSQRVEILNVCATPVVPRLGGVQIQLAARLRAERALRGVALVQPGALELSRPALHRRKIPRDFDAAVAEGLRITGARTIHLEGTDGVPIATLLRLAESGIRLIVSLHDCSLFGSGDPDRRRLGAQLLTAASAVIYPSSFLLEEHRRLFSLPDLLGEVIEPGVSAARVHIEGPRPAIAFAGSVMRHKGGHLLPEVIRLSGDAEWHIFGGGDEELLRALRGQANVHIHGYYRSGELPSLLGRHRVGLVVLPSIVPESFGLVLSETWLAGAAAVAFDHGALAERIRRDGGGWLAPLDRGAEGLAELVREWRAGGITASTPAVVPTSTDAARATAALYRLGIL